MFNFNDAKTQAKYKTRGIPWKGKMGIDISDCKTMEEAIVKAKLDYTVSKCQLVAKMKACDGSAQKEDAKLIDGYEYIDFEGCYATYRTDSNIPLGAVGSRYEVVQNRTAFSFFDDAIGDHIKLDRAGYFGYGQKIFLSASIDRDFNIGGINDKVKHYFVFTNSHNGGTSVQIIITPIRVICMNALHAATVNADMMVRFQHNIGINRKLLTVPEILGITNQQINDEEEMYEVMYNTKVNDEQVMKYISETFFTGEEYEKATELNLFKGLYSRDNSAFEQSEISSRKLNTINNVWEYYQDGIGQRQIAGTAYGAYNAVTGYFCNVKEYKNEEVRLKNTVFESDYYVGQRALNLALAL